MPRVEAVLADGGGISKRCVERVAGRREGPAIGPLRDCHGGHGCDFFDRGSST